MFISFSSEKDYPHPELLPAALEHLRPAIGPLRFRVEAPGSLNGTIPFRRRRDGQALKGGLGLLVGLPGPDWEAWQTLALDPTEPNRARIAVRCALDWYPTRGSWLLAWAVLQATLRLLLGPENEPHPLPKTCLNHADPNDRVGAFAHIRGGYICKGCCTALQARGIDPFAIDQLQEAAQLVRAGLIRPQHYRPRPGRIRLVEQLGKLEAELPDYGPGRLGLEPLQLALYVLLLSCPEGVPTTRSQGQTEALTQRLADLYRRANPNVTSAQAREKALAALGSARLSELVSFINAHLAERTPSAVLAAYQIVRRQCERTGQRVRRVDLPRELVEDKAGALTSS